MNASTYRVFRGSETRQIDGHTGRPALPAAWYFEPTTYEGDTLYSPAHETHGDANAAAAAESGADLVVMDETGWRYRYAVRDSEGTGLALYVTEPEAREAMAAAAEAQPWTDPELPGAIASWDAPVAAKRVAASIYVRALRLRRQLARLGLAHYPVEVHDHGRRTEATRYSPLTSGVTVELFDLVLHVDEDGSIGDGLSEPGAPDLPRETDADRAWVARVLPE